MSASTGPDRPGSPLRVADLFDLFPKLPELAPLLTLLVSGSQPDARRRWSGSGELGTVGGRLVDAETVSLGARERGGSEAERIERLWGNVARIVEALASGDGEGATHLLLEQGRVEESGGRPREAERWYLAGHRVARDLHAERAPEALRLAARAARTLGRLEEAARRYEAARRDAEDLGREEDVVIALIGRGNVAVDQGRWEDARAWYARALERVGESGEPRRERWQLFQNLSIVHRRSGALDDARRALERAQAEGDRLADPDAGVEIGHGWGRLHLAEGDPRAAELHFAEALRGASSRRARITIGVSLGEALLAQGKALEAAEVARAAEAEAIASGAVSTLPEVYRLLAGVSRARGEGDAFVFLEEALDLIREQELPPFEAAVTREAYGEHHLREGDPVRAVAEFEEAARVYRELEMEDEAARIARRLSDLEPPPLPGSAEPGEGGRENP